MPDLHIHRDHTLGLAKARKIALQWAEEVEQRFDMECGILEGKDGDTVQFERAGVSGTLQVRADHFELKARLGFLLGPFAKVIETEIEKNLDDLLSREGGAGKAATKAAKPSARKASQGRG